MTDDIHNYEQRLESTHQNILHKKTCQNCSKKTKDEECPDCGSEDLQHIIREENRELATEFKEHQADRELSFSRRYRYLISLKKMMEYNDFRLDNLREDEENKQKIRTLLRQIKDAAYRLLNIDDAWENLQNVSDREKDLLEGFLEAMDTRPDKLLFVPEEDQSDIAVEKSKSRDASRSRAELLENIVVENEGDIAEKEQEQILKITGTEPEIGNRFLLYPKQNSLTPAMTEYSPTIEVEDEKEYLLHWLLFRRIKQSGESNKKLLKGLHHSLPDGEMDETLEEMIEEFSSEDRGRNQK